MIKSALIYAGSYVVMRGASFVVLPYVARVLGPEEFGRLDLLIVASQVAGLLATFGVVEAVLRFAGGGKGGGTGSSGPMDERTAMANGLALTMLSGLVFLILALALMPFLVPMLPGDQDLGLMNLAMLSGVASAWTALPTMIFRMHDQAMRYAGFMIVQAFLQAGGNVLAVSLGFGVFGIMFTSAAVISLMAAYALITMAREAGLALDPKVARRLLIYGLPILASAVAAFMMNGLERWVLAARVDAETYGLYAAAAKLFVLCVIAFQPFMLWWSAQRFRLINAPNGETQLVRYAFIGILLLFALCTAVSLMNPLIVRFFFGADYPVPVWWVSALLAIVLLRTTSDLTSIGLFLGETSNEQMVIQYIAAAVTLAGIFTLIPLYGFPGLVAALIPGAAVRLVLVYTRAQRRRPLPYPLAAIGGLFVLYAAASAALALLVAPDAHLTRLGLTALVLGVLAAWAYGLAGRVLRGAAR